MTVLEARSSKSLIFLLVLMSYLTVNVGSKWHLLPLANEVWGKVIFSEACVQNSVHRGCGIPACIAVVSQHAFQVSRGYSGTKLRGLARGGLQAHTLGGLQAQTRGVQTHTGGRGVVYPSMHWGRPPSCTATAVGGTRPTGMYSCFDKI